MKSIYREIIFILTINFVYFVGKTMQDLDSNKIFI